MFAKSMTKYLLMAGFSINYFNLSAVATESSSNDSSLVSPEPSNPEKKLPTREEILSPAYLSKISATYGHMIMKSLSNPSVTLSVKDVIQGIQDALDGKPSPMTEKECEEALRLIQQFAYSDLLMATLRETESFLKENSKLEGIVEIVPEKLQYKVLQEGSGDEEVTEETTPTVHYSASYQGGMSLGSSDQHGGPMEIDLGETIPGFRRGVLGMKVGEKRRLFIHPEFAYQNGGPMPNGLMIFDIEVVKVAPRAPQFASAMEPSDESNDEDEEPSMDISDDDYDSDDDDESDLAYDETFPPMLDRTLFEDDEENESSIVQDMSTDSSDGDYVEYEDS
jgi:peptidylprolyl isomerase